MLRDVVVRLRLDTTQFKAAVASAAASTKTFGAQTATGAAQGTKSLGLLSSSYATVGLVAGTAGVAFVKSAADFDQAMANVNATGAATRGELAALEEQALEFGRTTVYSATEAAGGIEALLKAGLTARDVMGDSGGLAASLDLAAASNLDVEQSAEAVSIAMQQFSLQGKDAAHVSDLLAAGAGKSVGEVSDLSMALNQSGLVARTTGLSIEETVGALSAFASAGLVGSDAGTSFKTMLQRLAKPTDEATALMDELGISAYDAQGNFVGLAEFAGTLKSGLAGMSEEQRQATLATIFGSDAVRAATVLFEEGEGGIKKWTGAVDDAGYAADVAAKKTDTLAGDLDRMKNSWKALAEGSGGDGGLRPTVQRVGDLADGLGLVDRALDKVKDGFRDLAPETSLSNLQATIVGAKAIAEGLDWQVAIKFKTEGTPGAIKDAAAVARAADLVPEEVRSYLELLNWSPEGIDKVLERMNSIDQRVVTSQLQLLTGMTEEQLAAAQRDLDTLDKTVADPRIELDNLPESQAALVDLWKDVLRLDKSDPEVDISVENEDALSQIREVMDAIKAMTSLTGFVEVYGGRAMGGAIGAYAHGGRARGAIRGAGGPTQDSIPARLSNGEHVLTASDVRKMGGQDEVYAFRRALQAGPRQFAAGGATYSEPTRSYAAGGAVSAPVGGSQSVNVDVHIRRLSMATGDLLASMEVVATDAAGRVLADQVFEAAIA